METDNVFSAEADLRQLKPFSNVFVANAHKSKRDLEWHGVSAKWDTGATICSITKSLSDRLGLRPEHTMSVSSFSGSKDCLYDVVALSLSDAIGYIDVLAIVVDALPNADCDMLIGMNLISQGELILSTDFDKMKIKIEFLPHPGIFKPLK